MRKVLAILGLLSNTLAFAQQSTDSLTATASPTPTSAAEKNELKYNLNASGSHFFKATFLNQTWLRYNQSNPGTTVVGDPKENTFDIGLRRTRIQMYGQINDHVVLYLQFGLNNFNFQNGFPAFNTAGTPSNRKIQAFFHDAVGEYLVWKNKDYLKIGAGLTIVNGLSRFSQPSVSSIMTMDVPVFAQATVDQTDEFSRKLSVYARGQVGPIDYRFAVSDPFPVQTSGSVPPALGPNANFALKGHHKQFQGMVLYQFFDKESNQTPGYMTGTYLGKKKIFNLEAGFISQKNAVWYTGETATDTVYQNLNLWSVAAFLDVPVNRATGSAFSAYAGYFNLDYGKNYLRYNGIMNPATGTMQSVGGLGGTQGNAFPMFGTGSVIYSQVGYLFRQDLLGTAGTLMPYAQAQIGNYDRINGSMGVYNMGLNWLIKGHNSKLTLDYQSRPYYQAQPSGQLDSQGRRGQVVLQYQVFI
ncbi:hypothetical protein ACFQ4C_05895 [Larkinella insperata]|uniref:Porin n=1 Tax=Larkinella insperata TaxID=332158 RepID=A0ABW3Q1B2_9BACT|nr:hypothetical protein [Larkinella insperata]